MKSPVTWCSLGYFGATLSFLFSVNTDYLPGQEWPIVGNLLPIHHILWTEDPLAVLALVLMWCVHFVRRFGEVLFLHDYRRGFKWYEALGTNIYYWGFGFWVGYSINYSVPVNYRTPSMGILIAGIFLFVCGEIGNCLSHVALRRLRTKANGEILMELVPSRHVMPTGRPFRYITCPHYLAEMITWLGFAIASCTLASVIFGGVSFLVLLVLAQLKHAAYKKEFDGTNGKPLLDPKKKALIPRIC